MTVETVEIAGVTVPLDPLLMSPHILSVLRAGRWEQGETRILPTILEDGERVVDIGAGIGFLAALIGLQGKAESVVAIEANPELTPFIEALLEINGVEAQVRSALVAPTRTSPTLPFHLHNDLWASSPIRMKDSALRGVVDLPVMTLDEVAQAYRPTLMIIDIEVMRGFLAGGPAAARHSLSAIELSGVRKILTEFKRGRFSPAEVKAVFDGLSGCGFGYDAVGSQGELVLFRRVEP